MLNFKHTVLASALVLSSGVSVATPIYYGDTDADFVGVPGDTATNSAGYYIWSNEVKTEWSVRWTGNHFGTDESYNWWGNIEVGNNLTSTTPYMFEFSANEDLRTFDADWNGDDDLIQYKAVSGVQWDGFDFVIDQSDEFQVLGFNLGSDLFDFTHEELASDYTAGQYIFIGDEFETPDVLIQQYPAYTQQFEIRVPEPTSFFMFSLGLAGIIAARRKKA